MNPEKSKGKKNRSRIARSSKRKGKQFEGKIAKMFNEWFCPDEKGRIHRTPSSGNFVFPGDIFDTKEKLPFTIECKKRKNLNFSGLLEERTELWAFWHQCLDECVVGKIPLLVFGQNYGPDYTMIGLEWFQILEEYCGDFQGIILEADYSRLKREEGKVVIIKLKDFLEHFGSEMVRTIPELRKKK